MKLLSIFVSMLLLFGLLSSCTPAEPLTSTAFILDTIITVTLYDGGSEAILAESISLCQQYDDLWNKSKPDSELSRINSAGGQPVTVSDDTADLLTAALEYCALSDGLFDITIGAVTALWDFRSGTAQLPDPEELETALESVDYRLIHLDGNTVTVLNPETRLDIGAIAKGYIADRMAEFLRERGVVSAIIDLGGNIVTLGDKYGSPFRIGIRDPNPEHDREIEVVEVCDRSLVTSGLYERSFTLDGVLYHHILNPKTGYPVEGDLLSVTIISPLSVDGDALSTICFLLGEGGSQSFLNQFPEISAVLINEKEEVIHIQSDAVPSSP